MVGRDSDGIVEFAVEEGDQGQVVGGVGLTLPENLGVMGEGVANGGEATLEQHGEAGVFGPLGIGLEGVESEPRILQGEGFLHKSSSVAG